MRKPPLQVAFFVDRSPCVLNYLSVLEVVVDVDKRIIQQYDRIVENLNLR